MNNTTLTLSETWLDLEPICLDTVELFPDQIQAAVDLSQQISDPTKQWQVYLNALGVFGFENWLGENSSDLNLDSTDCSLYHPELQVYLDGVCQLQVNQFKVCLLTVGSLTDEVVAVPRMMVDLPEYAAHFYIIMEIQEELETARVFGFFSYKDWLEQQPEGLAALEDWTYDLPLSGLHLNPEQFLLQLRCLQPSDIPLPVVPDRTPALSARQTELEQQLPQLCHYQNEIPALWQQLTWEQGAVVLTQPELLQWLSQHQTPETTETSTFSNVRVYLSDLLKLLTQPSLNVGQWLSQQVENLTTDLSWMLMPNLSLDTALGMRSGSDEFCNLLQELQQAGVEMPSQVGGGYRDLSVGQIPLRLYTVTWPLGSEVNPEWSLLLVLGTPSGTHLPTGVKLRVSDATAVLDEQTPETTTPYIYTQVVGGYQEKFIATLSVASEVEETLPPFTFMPGMTSS